MRSLNFVITIIGILVYPGTTRRVRQKDDSYSIETKNNCDISWKAFNYIDTLCYKVLGPGNYHEAIETCEKEGAKLISIHKIAFDNLVRRLDEDVLIGLRFTEHESDDGNRNKLPNGIWADGSSIDYVPDDVAQLKELQPYLGDCVAIWNRKWRNVDCNKTKLKFVCTKTNSSSNRVCPDESTLYTNPTDITSPGYPKKYIADPLLDCDYQLAVPNGFLAKLTFTELNLDNDYIIVFNGLHPDSRSPIGIVSGDGTGYEKTFVSKNSNLISLEFVGAKSGKWKAHLEAVQENI